MTTLYKLTDDHGRTYGGTQWGVGVTYTAPGKGSLGTAGWIHAYTSPEMAVVMNPVHTCFTSPLLWEASGKIGRDDGGLQCGTTALTTLRQVAGGHTPTACPFCDPLRL